MVADRNRAPKYSPMSNSTRKKFRGNRYPELFSCLTYGWSVLVFYEYVGLFYTHTDTWYWSRMISCFQKTLEHSSSINILYWFTGTRPCFKCKMYFSILRVPTSGPSLWLGQLHFSLCRSFWNICASLLITFVPILHIHKRENVVYL